MPQSGSEPRFGPEPLRTGPKSGPRFGIVPELNRKSGSGFGREPDVVNLVQTEPDPEPVIPPAAATATREVALPRRGNAIAVRDGDKASIDMHK